MLAVARGVQGNIMSSYLHQICKIIGVSRHPPPARSQQETGVLLAIAGVVLAANKLCRSSPDAGLALLRTNMVALIVCRTKDGITKQSKSENTRSLASRQVSGVAGEILSLQGVEGGQECRISPGQHESKVVVANVDGPRVPVLIAEKVDHVHGLQDVDDHHRVGDVTQTLVLIGCPRKVDQSPGHNTRTTIMEELEIPVGAKSRVEFDASPEIVDQTTTELAVLRMRWEEVALHLRKDCQSETIHIDRHQETLPIIRNECRINVAIPGGTDVQSVSQCPRQKSVRFVVQLVSRWGLLAEADLARKRAVQDGLKEKPACVSSDCSLRGLG